MKLIDLINKIDYDQAVNLRVKIKGANDREIDFYKIDIECYSDYVGEKVRNIFTYGKMLCVEVGDKLNKGVRK